MKPIEAETHTTSQAQYEREWAQVPPYPIRITEEGLLSITEKSIFNVPHDQPLIEFVGGIVGPAEYLQPMYQPERDTYKRVVDTDGQEPIGWDEFGNPVWAYTVLTTAPENPDDPHDLFNAFPGT